MARIEQKFIYDGDSFDIVFNRNGVKIFLSASADKIVLTDKDDEVLFSAHADCNQNEGFIVID